MVFRYGADSSRFVEEKIHRPEEKWSELVYYDAPRCILCFRCVRVCDEGMDVKALGVGMRGANSVIIPNRQDHLECEEDRKSTRLNSSHGYISYAVFCLKKKIKQQ